MLEEQICANKSVKEEQNSQNKHLRSTTSNTRMYVLADEVLDRLDVVHLHIFIVHFNRHSQFSMTIKNTDMTSVQFIVGISNLTGCIYYILERASYMHFDHITVYAYLCLTRVLGTSSIVIKDMISKSL